MTPLRVVVVGAGAVGCAIAAKLARRDCRVTVVDRGQPGGEASGAAAGILGAGAECGEPGPLLDLCTHSLDLWPDFVVSLRQRVGFGCGWETCGAIEVARDADSAVALDRKGQLLAGVAASLAPRWLDARELRVRVPELADDVCGGLLHPGDGQVEPALLAKALAIDAARCGAQFHCGQGARALVVQHGHVTAVACDRETLQADAVVIAAGAWSQPLLAGLTLRTTVRPQRGQLALVEMEAPPLRPVLVWRGGYAVPRRDGRIVLGATADDAGFDKRVTAGGMLHLLAMATAVMPALGEGQLRDHWAGLRPMSADGLPLLGPHPEVAGLFLATGHHRNGILLVPATAQVVAQAVLQADTSVDLSPFLPA
ncbi:MAG: glycine oxidase ThiO [Deltaproteobacteria bacterium]|nr:glycine oxidase ThiO [Deltaproteobacteria bacterium]